MPTDEYGEQGLHIEIKGYINNKNKIIIMNIERRVKVVSKKKKMCKEVRYRR